MNMRKLKYVHRFGLSTKQADKLPPLLDQLDRCADDASRRLLLGISKQQKIHPKLKNTQRAAA
jgi:hypothetical protein